MPRVSLHDYFMGLARMAAKRSTCARRNVGCVLVSERGHVLATGYNGVPSGAIHCIDSPCPGADIRHGAGLDKCEAVHAETNALIQCRDVDKIYACYSTSSPCVMCARALLNTPCKLFVFDELYEAHWPKVRVMLGAKEIVRCEKSNLEL